MVKITASVGRIGKNLPADVKIVKQLLNNNLLVPYQPIDVDDKVDAATVGMIEEFQRRILKIVRPDGRVDPGGKTLQALSGEKAAAAPAPADKPFLDRVKEFQDHVKTTFNMTIGVISNTREPLWQQRMHVAHMIKYNSYKHVVTKKGIDVGLKPKQYTNVDNHDLIAWDHLKDPKVIWGGGVQPDEFLRDSLGRPCRKTAAGWDNEPDEDQTREQAFLLLQAEHVEKADNRTEPNSAMVAPGIQGCAEPCRCGGNRSNHLAGLAVDLNHAAVDTLTAKLDPPTKAQLDKLLAEFGLHRPMASERWHVEPIN